MGIFYTEPDLLFWVLSLVSVLSFIAGIYTIKHYLLVRSKDYLLITINFFSWTIWCLIWIFWSLLYIDIASITDKAHCAPGIDCYFDWDVISFLVVLQFAWSIGWLALSVHVVRLYNFRNWSILKRLPVGLLFMEIIRLFFYINIHAISLAVLKDPEYFGGAFYGTDPIILKLWFSHLFFERVSDAINFDMVLIHLFIAIGYLFANPELKVPEVKISRYLWTLYGLAISYFYLQFIIHSNPNLEFLFIKNLEFAERWSLIVGAFVPIFVIIIYYPQTLLITKSQISRAHGLYKIILSKSAVSSSSGSTNNWPLPRSKDQIISYIEKLPLELLETQD